MTYNCILHSFEKSVLDRLYEIDQNLNLGFLFEKLPIHRVSYAKGLHPSKELLSKINPDDRQNHWIASWTFRSIADYQKTEEKDLPDILIADPIEDFCQFFQNKT